LLRWGWPHLPPCGYVSVRNADGHGSYVAVHPRRGPLVTRAFELYGSGAYSLRTLAQQLAKEGLTSKSGVPVPQSQIRRLLTNPFYVGRVVSKGVDTAGQHPPLTSTEVFDRVQILIRQRSRDVGTKGSVGGFPLRSIAICAICRGRMTAERHGRWGYYRCSRQTYKKERCKARFSNAGQAHADLRRICGELTISRNTAETIRQHAEQAIAARLLDVDKRQEKLQQEHDRLVTEEMAIADAFATGSLSADAFHARTNLSRQKRERIERYRRQEIPDAAQIRAKVDQLLNVATNLWDLYEPLDDHHQTELLRIIFRTIVLSPDGIAGYVLNAPFDAFRKGTTSKAQAAALVNAVDPAVEFGRKHQGTS